MAYINFGISGFKLITNITYEKASGLANANN